MENPGCTRNTVRDSAPGDYVYAPCGEPAELDVLDGMSGAYVGTFCRSCAEAARSNGCEVPDLTEEVE